MTRGKKAAAIKRMSKIEHALHDFLTLNCEFKLCRKIGRVAVYDAPGKDGNSWQFTLERINSSTFDFSTPDALESIRLCLDNPDSLVTLAAVIKKSLREFRATRRARHQVRRDRAAAVERTAPRRK